jgi:hypothetical protein
MCAAGFVMTWFRQLFGLKQKLNRAEATATASIYMVETLAQVMIKTTYGLSRQGIASMFRASADHLIQGIDKAESEAEKSGLLIMAKEISDLADRLAQN